MLFSRSKDIDKLQRLSRVAGSFQNQRHSNNHSQTPTTHKEFMSQDNNVTEFRQKWQNLWQTSADRKKLLENLAKQLTQVRSLYAILLFISGVGFTFQFHCTFWYLFTTSMNLSKTLSAFTYYAVCTKYSFMHLIASYTCIFIDFFGIKCY